MNYYELIIRYDRTTIDCVVFKDERMAFSGKGIIDIAIQKDIIDEEMREMIENAKSLDVYEYEYINELLKRNDENT